MTAPSKLLVAFAAAALAVCVTGAASAERSTSSSGQKPPAETPVQIMPAGIYPLTPEREQALRPKDGTTTPFWFGNTISAQNANYVASTPYAGGPRGVDSKGPVVVDSYAPNPFGLYQVHGNVWEWTEDCYNKRYTEDTPTDGAPWLEGDCTKRMVRGGTWNWSADNSRSGYRSDSWFGTGNSFRVVRTLNVQ